MIAKTKQQTEFRKIVKDSEDSLSDLISAIQGDIELATIEHRAHSEWEKGQEYRVSQYVEAELRRDGLKEAYRMARKLQSLLIEVNYL